MKHFSLSRLSTQLLSAVFLLSLIGIVVLFEASAAESLAKFGEQYFFIKQQLQWFFIGYVVLFSVVFVPMQWWQKLGPVLYWTGVVSLIAVLIPQVGVEVNGATRWLSVAGFRFQPVEVMKLGMIVYFSSWLTTHQRIVPFLTLTLIPVILVLLQPDLGSTLVLLAIAFGIYTIAGGKWNVLIALAVGGGALLMLLILSSPYKMERIRTYLDPSADPHNTGYHIRQITLALGNGGLFGVGLGQSRQKYLYIPEVSTDSIFSIIAEETGLLGSSIVIGIFLYTIHTAFRIVKKQDEQTFSYHFATGVTIWLAAHILINLAAVVALVPLTGIPLPFISRGGTALVTMLMTVGILVRLGADTSQQSATSPRARQRVL